MFLFLHVNQSASFLSTALNTVNMLHARTMATILSLWTFGAKLAQIKASKTCFLLNSSAYCKLSTSIMQEQNRNEQPV